MIATERAITQSAYALKVISRMAIQARTRLAGRVLTALGLVLVAAGFLAAFSVIGVVLFCAGVIAAAQGIFLLRVRSSTALVRGLLETIGIVIALAMLGGLLWWSGATVIGGE